MNASELSPADRFWLFDESLAEEIRALAETLAASYADSLSITQLTRSTIYLQSSSTDLASLQEECQNLASRQLEINTTFIRLFQKHQGLVKTAVRSGVGSAKGSCDPESLSNDAWVIILRALATYEHKSDGQERAWIRQLASGVGSHAREKSQNRVRAVGTALERDKGAASLACGNSYAVTAEDRQETELHKGEGENECD